MRFLPLLALVALATSQRIDQTATRDGACVETTIGTSPVKFDFQPKASEISAVLAQQPKAPQLRNPEGYAVTAPTAAPTDISITFGARERTLRRLVPNQYADGTDLPRGTCIGTGTCANPRASRLENGEFIGNNLPNPRAVSLAVSTSFAVLASRRNLHDLAGHFGQFLSHDTTLVPEDGTPEGVLDIEIPEGDPVFDPNNEGGQFMLFRRSIHESRCSGQNPRGRLLPASATNVPREHNNEISSFIDATMIYGGTTGRQTALRATSKSKPGEMKTSTGNLLPFNNVPQNADTAQDNPRGDAVGEQYFGGDVRTNEAPGLTLLITIFVREHNRLAKHHAAFLRRTNKPVVSDAIFAWSKKILIASLQKIAFREWLPALFGEPFPPFDAAAPVTGPSDLFAEFSTATRRFGHTMINSFLPIVYGRGDLSGITRLDLGTSLFRTVGVVGRTTGGVEPLLRGILCIRAQQMDTVVSPGLQQRLFPAEPGHPERDLVALNIQRGREHGIGDFNSVRTALGRGRLTSFAQINPSNPELTRQLATLYGNNIDSIDLFIGVLAEEPADVRTDFDGPRGKSEFGPTLNQMMRGQFSIIRNADSFYFERTLSQTEISLLPDFSKILEQNSRVFPKSLFPTDHSIMFHPLFCRSVLNFQCQARSRRQENYVCDRLYTVIPDLANSTQPSNPPITFPWLL